MTIPQSPTTLAKASAYEAVHAVFMELSRELRELCKKKPDATLSVSKVNLINRLLSDMKNFLNDEPDGKYLDILDADALPQYSDAVLILSQYEGCLKSFKDRYYVWNSHTLKHQWHLKG